jgi:hypothetical protein
MPRLAIIHFLDGADGPVDPGYGMPGYGGGRPDNSLPGSGGHPGNALPPPGHIVTLPVYPFDPTRPDAGLPPSQPGVDNGLPSVRPGMKFIAKWVQCGGLILVPDNELPETPQPK